METRCDGPAALTYSDSCSSASVVSPPNVPVSAPVVPVDGSSPSVPVSPRSDSRRIRVLSVGASDVSELVSVFGEPGVVTCGVSSGLVSGVTCGVSSGFVSGLSSGRASCGVSSGCASCGASANLVSCGLSSTSLAFGLEWSEFWVFCCEFWVELFVEFGTFPWP